MKYLYVILGLYFCYGAIRIIIKRISGKSKMKTKIERCTSIVKGTIVDMKEGKKVRIGRRLVAYNNIHQFYNYVFEYEVNFKKYTTISETSYDGGINNCHEEGLRQKVGEEVDIYYNPENPEEIYVKVDGEEYASYDKLSIPIAVFYFILGLCLTLYTISNW